MPVKTKTKVKTMDKPYGALAEFYEYFIADCDYEKWSQYLLLEVKKHYSGGSCLDIACGSGYFTRALKRAGFDVTGVDISPEMLEEAGEKTLEEGLRIDYVLQDVVNLKSINKVNFVTCINDGFNYIPPQKLGKAFKNVAACLKKGGLFFFDISSAYKLENILGNNMFGEDGEEASYMWFNEFSGGKVTMDLVVFKRENNGLYSKREETHVQYAHTQEFIGQKLNENGFKVLKICAHLGQPLKNDSDRIEFIAVKE